jgi:D-serine deaminase-like pyridoxal phosphate-dependent protein
MDLNKITRPSMILDEVKCRNNIRSMAAKASNSGVIFRPHFKTHQSLTIGEWFREEGVKSITVSSLTMARHFASGGWNDITIAFPFNIREAADAKTLASKVNLNILVSGLEHAGLLKARTRFKAGCFIKIDTGYHRSGTDWNDANSIVRIAAEIESSKNLRLAGFLTHSGHSYKAGSMEEIGAIYNDTLGKFNLLRKIFPQKHLVFSTGDTPSCSLTDDFTGFSEIRPGNFVFYDLTQHHLGSCKKEQIAVAVACPVVEKNIQRREIVIYGGGVHLSKENLELRDGRVVYGEAVILTESGWEFLPEASYLRSLSQEHGTISASEELFSRVQTGDILGVIPVHSCMTADLMRVYLTFDDKIISDFSPK